VAVVTVGIEVATREEIAVLALVTGVVTVVEVAVAGGLATTDPEVWSAVVTFANEKMFYTCCWFVCSLTRLLKK